MRILLTNDDGITAPGLIALYRAIRDMGEVKVIAPAQVESAMSHSITFNKPIVTRRHVMAADTGEDLFDGIAVEGRPADCVKLALASIMRDRVDLVISGMNSGANIGINVIYSGTVAAAMEAAFIGVPSIAVSLHIGNWNTIRWDDAAAYARQTIDRLLKGPVQPHTVLNVNVPILDDGATPRGVKVVPISTSPLIDEYIESDDPTGDSDFRHFTAGDHMRFRYHHPGTDVEALFDRYITVTPLQYDMTQHPHIQPWRDAMEE